MADHMSGSGLYESLQRAPRQIFDEFTQLAASVLAAPVALICLLDDRREWFASHYGSIATPGGHEVGLCREALGAAETLIVPDVSLDPRFAMQPLIIGGAAVRFYAGVPLISPEGAVLGALCVLDHVPRQISDSQRTALKILGQHLMAQLELRRRLQVLAQEHIAAQEGLREINRAIGAQEFVLRYEPTVRLSDGRCESVSAEIAWQQSHGLLPGTEFMPLLEESGLVTVVGRSALMQAAAAYRHWMELGIPAPRVSLRLPGPYFRHTCFLTDLDQAIGAGTAHPVPLDIEIAESSLLEQTELVLERIGALRQRGLRVSIDGFGSGASSLRYLARSHACALRIEQPFIGAMGSSADGMAVISSIIALAHGLGMTVTASGVESEEQRKLLRLLRCDRIQGSLISSSLDAQALTNLFRSLAIEPAEQPAAAVRQSPRGTHPRRRVPHEHGDWSAP